MVDAAILVVAVVVVAGGAAWLLRDVIRMAIGKW